MCGDRSDKEPGSKGEELRLVRKRDSDKESGEAGTLRLDDNSGKRDLGERGIWKQGVERQIRVCGGLRLAGKGACGQGARGLGRIGNGWQEDWEWELGGDWYEESKGVRLGSAGQGD